MEVCFRPHLIVLCVLSKCGALILRQFNLVQVIISDLITKNLH